VQRFGQIERKPYSQIFLSTRVVIGELWIADRKLLHQFEGFLNAAVKGAFLQDSFAALAHHYVPLRKS